MREVNVDVLIVGGGPAGLSAALVLGRCRRQVLVCDTGRQRNRFSRGLHGYLTRDGIEPSAFLALARGELARYDGVELRETEVQDAERRASGFEVRLVDGAVRTRVLLLATGVVDHLPSIEGIESLYGRSVHHCPYCDGWEWRNRELAVYGRGDAKGAGLALFLKQWSADVVLCTDGPAELSEAMRTRLAAQRIPVREERIARLEGDSDGMLQHIAFDDGSRLARGALFFNTGQHQRSPLAERLGCAFTERGGVEVGEHGVATNVPRLYVAGDASRDVQLVIVAAAEGAKAAFAINKALATEDGLGED